MKYRVEISKEAARQISKLPKHDKQNILDTIEALGNDPQPHGYKKLVYHTEYFRISGRKLSDRLSNQGQGPVRVHRRGQTTKRINLLESTY